VPIRILWAFIGFILQYNDDFKKGVWSPKAGFPYYIIIVNISQIWAIYCLLVFYHTMHEEIRNIKPLGKFLSIKLMVFAVFWQQIIINLCVRFRFINSTATYSLEEVAGAVQDLLICIEMLILAISHLTIWPSKEFYDASQDVTTRQGLTRMMSALNPKDMWQDIVAAPKLVKKKKPGTSGPLSPTGTPGAEGGGGFGPDTGVLNGGDGGDGAGAGAGAGAYVKQPSASDLLPSPTTTNEGRDSSIIGTTTTQTTTTITTTTFSAPTSEPTLTVTSEPADHNPVEKRSPEKRPSEKRLSEKRLSEKRLSEKRLSEKRLSEKRLSEKRDSQSRSVCRVCF